MRYFTEDELSRMQGMQESAMQDVCIVQSYSRTLGSYGDPVETYTDGSSIVCGVEMTEGSENRRADLTAEKIIATVRLPIGTVLKATDRIKITQRYGSTLTSPEVYEIVGEIQRGPSGLVVDLGDVNP